MFSTIQEYQQALYSGTTSCVAVVNNYIEKINQHKRLNAFTEVYTTEALERAALLDNQRTSGKQPGKLHGVVVALKDVICYKGYRALEIAIVMNLPWAAPTKIQFMEMC